MFLIDWIKIWMLVMVLDGTFHSTYERGSLDNNPQFKVNWNSIYFGQLVHSKEYIEQYFRSKRITILTKLESLSVLWKMD